MNLSAKKQPIKPVISVGEFELHLNKNAISVEHFSRWYGELKVVDNATFYVRDGELFSLLGIDGDGKTTIFNSLITPHSVIAGKISIFGVEKIDFLNDKKGVVRQDTELKGEFSVCKNLVLCGKVLGLKGKDLKKAVFDTLNNTDLNLFAKTKYGKLTLQEKRQVVIASSLLKSPTLLLLDEPTRGLNAHERQKILIFIRKLQTQLNLTIFLTTQYLSDALASDGVAIIRNGKIKAQGIPSILKEKNTFEMFGF